MPERPGDQRDINPAVVARDPLLSQVADMVAYLDLHIGRYPWQQLTTPQKELFADLVDSHAVSTVAAEHREIPARVARWWRDSWDGPVDDADPRWADHSSREPDPFIYDERRTTPPPTYDRPDQGALDLARSATLGAGHGEHAPWLLEDQVAVYEWAKRSAKPFRNTAGDIVAGYAVYPCLNDARTFLAGYRAARHDPNAH